jgi:copper(I)-binding protein
MMPVVLAAATVMSLKINHAWIRTPAPSVSVTAAFAEIHNPTKQPISIHSVQSSCAKTIELHETTKNEQGMMGMQQRSEITIKPQETLKLEPGGLHVMLFEFKATQKTCELKFLDKNKKVVAEINAEITPSLKAQSAK